MSKNKSFYRKYTIEFKGITTNEFMVEFLDTTIGNIVKSLAKFKKQTTLINYTVEGEKSDE